MLRKDDVVQVIAGRDKGKVGKILRVNEKSMRVTVEKVNLVKRHTKPTQAKPGGGILEKETPVHYSNILLMCAKCNKGVRYGIKLGDAPEKKTKKTKGSAEASALQSARRDGSGARAKAGVSASIKIRVCKKCGQSLERQ